MKERGKKIGKKKVYVEKDKFLYQLEILDVTSNKLELSL